MAAELARQTGEITPLPMRYGRNALYIHGLAFVFLGIAAVSALAMDWNNNDIFSVLAVNLSATLILSLWSLRLAWHALRRGESAVPVFALGMAMLFEASLVTQTFWLWPYQNWSWLSIYPMLRW